MSMTDFTPYSTVRDVAGVGWTPLPWYPDEQADRIAAYNKYDEIYWNDDRQFSVRVLEGETPLYIPNARVIVDTTAHYWLKGLKIACQSPEKNKELDAALTAFLDRELFYSRFSIAKHAGVARGDFAFHLTADPSKPAGSRLSLNSVHPGRVIPIYDPDDIRKVIRVHLVDVWNDPEDRTSSQQLLKKLTYDYVMVNGVRRVRRSEGIYKLNDKWYGQTPDLVKTTIPEGYLPESITTIPVYWFKNMPWEDQEYGSSELRGFERLLQGVSQAATDEGASLSLEGLGVYATDGGRPVDENGNETDWEVAPGKVMEVPTGSYFRRVEGLSTLKPSMDHIGYLEDKMYAASGLSDVALGRVDVQTAQSGIALAIKFMPTLAKLDERDIAGIGTLKQLFHDWRNWHLAYENEALEGEIVVTIGQKLPADRVATLNELNNMLDRKIISREFYRAQMELLGYDFPDDIQDQIDREAQIDIERQRQVALIQANSAADAGNQQGNQSNNKNRPNESSGTEATQTPQRQARGGTPQNGDA